MFAIVRVFVLVFFDIEIPLPAAIVKPPERSFTVVTPVLAMLIESKDITSIV